MKKTFGIAAVLLLATAPALAGHGKAGLWDVTTTMHMPNMPQIPPEALAMMKQRGMKIPGSGEPMHTRICMTQADVDSDLPRFTSRDMTCQPHILSRTGSEVTIDMVCSGEMKGTGHMHVAYSGAEHYTGSYSFRGMVDGHPQDMSSSFSGDWVKADCGAVKPFDRRP